MEKQIFFQSSLPRSGSTLLQNIIGQNPEFYVTPTSGLHDMVANARQIYTNSPNFKAQDSEEMKKAFLGFVNGGMQGYFNGITKKKLILDKSRGWINKIPMLELVQKSAKVICVVRDPRAIFASMEKNYRNHPDKAVAENYFPNDMAQNLLNRVNFWANHKQFVGAAFNNLKDLVDTKQTSGIRFIRYEDLVVAPQEVLDVIYEYLEIDGFKHDFNNIKQVTIEDDKFHGVFGNHEVQPVLKSVPNDFEEILGIKISNDIYKTYEWFYETFGYS